MLLDEKRPNIETFGGGKEESFSVGDLGRILKILRNSMYAHPIKAICREISSNARDAHREVGTPDRPIEIHLPNSWDQHYKIKDFGPGISPNRMSDVFIKFGNSTKNENNLQTGGFGLGAKTPLAYSDQFQICTISEDADGKRRQRTYIAYIDSSEAGKMRMVHEFETDEPTGTEISINVAEQDFGKFAEATTEVCQYWDPKPELTGRVTVEWPEETRDILLEKNNWKMFVPDRSGRGYYPAESNNKSLAIVDGIMYPINVQNIDGLDDYGISAKILASGVKIYFNTGDVRLSANREELQYDDKTCPVIIKVLEDIESKISDMIVEEVTKADTYSQAIAKYFNYKTYLSFAIKDEWSPTWNGIHVPYDKYIRLRTGKKTAEYDWSYYIEAFSFRQNRKTYKTVLSKQSESDLIIQDDGSINILLNDLTDGRVSRTRVTQFLNDNKTNYVFVVTASHGNVDEALERMKEENNHGIDINLFNPIRLSTVVPPKKPKKQRGAAPKRVRHSGFVYDASHISHRACDCYWRPTDLDLKNGSGVYVIVKGRTNDRFSADKRVDDKDASQAIALSKDDQFNVYGIRERDVSKIGSGWVPFHEWVEGVLKSCLNGLNCTEEYVIECMEENKHVLDINSYVRNAEELIISIEKNLPKDHKGLAKDIIERSSHVKKEYQRLHEAVRAINILKRNTDTNKTPKLVELKDQIKKTYPLLEHISIGYRTNPSKAVAQYIMLMDKEIQEEQDMGLDNSGGNDNTVVACNS